MPRTKTCKHCGSMHTKKNGKMIRWYHRKRYTVQRHLCNDCGRSSFGPKVEL